MKIARVLTQMESANTQSALDAAENARPSGLEVPPPSPTLSLGNVRLKQIKTVVTEITKERKSNGTIKIIKYWEVRVGSAISKVYSTPTGERDLFTLSYWVDGQRKRE